MRRFAVLGLVTLSLLVGGVAGRAATASNTVPAGTVGQGSAATSPYTISGVVYALSANSPKRINSVSFSISPTNARIVTARLATGGSWYGCTNVSGSVSCATTSPQATVTTVNNLTVVATQ